MVESRLFPITAAAALQEVTYRGQALRFLLPSTNIYRVAGDARRLARLSADFDDGRGFLCVTASG